MLQVLDVVIFSVDKTDFLWSIEGEIFFESDLSSEFILEYLLEDDEVTSFEINFTHGDFDKEKLINMIFESCEEFEKDYF